MSTSITPITPGPDASETTAAKVTHADAFNHLLVYVLQWGRDHPGHMALTQNGFVEAIDLLTYPSHEFQSLEYTVMNQTCCLNVVHVNQLKLFQSLLSDLWEDEDAFVTANALM